MRRFCLGVAICSLLIGCSKGPERSNDSRAAPDLPKKAPHEAAEDPTGEKSTPPDKTAEDPTGGISTSPDSR